MESVKTLYDDKDPAYGFDHIDRLYDFCVVIGEALGEEMDNLIPRPLYTACRRATSGG